MAPLSLWLELDTRCNLNCQFCYNPWRPDPDSAPATMPLSSLKTAIDTLARTIELEYVALSGGEPLLYRQLAELVEFISRREIPTVLTTNGRAVTRKRLSSLADQGLKAIQVPVLSHFPALHDELAGAKSWDSAIKALAISKELGLGTTLVTVLTAVNIDHLQHVLRLADLISADRVIVNRFHPAGQGLTHEHRLSLSTDEFDTRVSSALNSYTPPLNAEVVFGTGEVVERDAKSGHLALRRSHPSQQVNRITVSPIGEVKFCNQSTSAYTRFDAHSIEQQCQALARDLREDDQSRLLSTIRGCECRGS
ncbi:radical SAM protein [Saccharothrix stipae]